MEFSHLPLEIHLMTIRALDYKSLLNLSATSKAFHDIFLHEDKNLLKHALLDVEESRIPPTAFPTQGMISLFPCYGCHTLLLGCFFTRADWYSTSTRTGPNAFKRRCLTCQAKGKYRFTRHSRLLDVSGAGKEEYVYCGGCKLVMHTQPPSFYGTGQQIQMCYAELAQASTRKEFRCLFCQAKARREKWPQEERIMARNWMI